MLGTGEVLAVRRRLAGLDQVDRHKTLRESSRRLDGLRQARAQVLLHHQAVDDDLDGVLELLVERRRLVERVLLAVHLDAREALVPQLLEELPVLALPVADDRCIDGEPRAGRQGEDLLDDRVDRLSGDLPAANRAVRPANAREEQPQVVVDLGDRADSRSGIARRRLLVDRDRGAQPVDRIHVRLLHHLQELPRIRGEGLDVAPLPLGVDGVEGEARLTGARKPGDADERVPREPDRDVLQVVLPGAVDY